jgi:hypothetical protein
MSEGDDIDVPAAGAVAAAGGVDALTASAATSPTTAISGDAALAEALASGRIDAAAASELLIAEVVAEQLGPANPDTLAHVSEALQTLLADDPTLARLLRP